MRFILNNIDIELEGDLIKPIYKNCLHILNDDDNKQTIIKDVNRIFIKLDKNTNILRMTFIPYNNISINHKYIKFIK